MSRIAYVNGRYVQHSEAAVHVEDRGFQFADGVYEVCEVRNGFIVDLTRHLDRLDRSLRELRMASPMGRAALTFVLREVLRRNRVRNGIFYLQVTRGVARRDHYFPAETTPPTLTITAKSTDPSVAARKYATGIKVITVPENRWDRVDIKTVGLLPNVLAKQQAKDAGAQDAIFIDAAGIVMEGASSNVWIVDADGVLVTRPAEHGILKGITRTTAMDVADKLGLRYVEREFSVEEMMSAREVFFTSATGICVPIVEVDGRPIANGHPGGVSQGIRDAFFEVAEKTAI
ncbi:D-amino-acid transaminase [Rhizobium sp. LC145]|uniref:D-amino-acid transaminase n=1 Tax=Rhizobium sp. LC145 TaxID=1120688 RepID=UPI00062A202D|nr:D-amino-acid transaminase [Rhizobium sp. LC145]KKX33694.1 D-amino acid aminotransferase [Rhizobium sp. LC145]TKT55342.1 D-amino-acid transaminase [Rhizobiaceae bacterium LC148]